MQSIPSHYGDFIHVDSQSARLSFELSVADLDADAIYRVKYEFSIRQDVDESSQNINKTVGNLNETISNAKTGKGAINYLSNDANLVKNIDSTMNNLNKASSLLNQNLEALKHNFLFRGYFKKMEKEKLKTQKN